MQIQYSKNMGENVLSIYEGDEDVKESGKLNFREQMLLHNDIDGLLHVDILKKDDRKICNYRIEGKQTLSSFCEGKKLKADMLRKLLNRILRTIINGHEFMLTEEDYILSEDMIYVDAGLNAFLVYYSGYSHPFSEQIGSLASFLMNTVDYHDEKAVLMVYTFYMKTNEPDCKVESVYDIVKEPTEAPRAEKVGNPGPVLQSSVASTKVFGLTRESRERSIKNDQTTLMPPESMEETNEWPIKYKLIKVGIPIAGAIPAVGTCLIRFFDLLGGRPGAVTLLLILIADALLCVAGLGAVNKRVEKEFERRKKAREENEAPTVILWSEEPKEPEFCLVSDEYEPIKADRFPFYVGKDKTYADMILNYPGVSRLHLKIDRNGGEYVICDLNSTNGTYLNGERLASHIPVKVRRGDEIRIANCIYYCN